MSREDATLMTTSVNQVRAGTALLTISLTLTTIGCGGQTDKTPSTTSSNTPAHSKSQSVPPMDSNSTTATTLPENGASVSPSNDDTDAQTPTNPYEVAGITDPMKFNEIFRNVQDLAGKDDKQGLAEYVLYPLLLNKDGKNEKIVDQKAFITNYDRIFTKHVKAALQNQKKEKLFVNYKGVMVAEGEIWFGVTEKGDIGIQSVNVSTPSAEKQK
jgi:hypothetical protein